MSPTLILDTEKALKGFIKNVKWAQSINFQSEAPIGWVYKEEPKEIARCARLLLSKNKELIIENEALKAKLNLLTK